MKRIRFLLNLALILCLLLSCLPGAAAEEPSEDDERFGDKTWEEVIAEFLEKWGVEEKRITLGYYNTVTGEEHYLNPDQYMVSGSMYKVPLNMVFCAKVADGEMDWDTPIGVFKYETLLENTIVYSSNDNAKTLWLNLGNGTYRSYRRVIAPLMGEDPDTVDAKFYENNFFTARQMIFCLRELYENQDHYPRLIETMQRAEPTEYFKRYERRFDIAHKYGFLQTEYHLYMNDCGICFTDDPILIVLFTDNVAKAYEVMADYCTLMCDYAQYHTAQRIAEEAAEAARQAELARQAAEAAAQEAERLRQEGETQTANPDLVLPADPDATAEPGAEKPSGRTELRRTEQTGLSRTELLAVSGAALCTLTAMIVLAALGKKYRLRTRVLVLAALLLGLGTVGRIGWPSIRRLGDHPQGDPRETVTDFLRALEEQDYTRACSYLDGVESLGLENEPERESSRLLVAELRRQFHGELYRDCRIEGTMAWQQVECRYLDVSTLEWTARSEAMILISRYASSHPIGELYDENGNYRPELMRDAWDQAVTELLKTPEDFVSTGGVELELRWHDGAWHIVPGEKLLELLTGGLKLTGEEGLS